MVEPGNPLSLTSDKSTEAYRNWWPGPDRRHDRVHEPQHRPASRRSRARPTIASISTAAATCSRPPIAARSPSCRAWRQTAEARGGGPARLHETASSPYTPSPERGFDFALTGADVITDASLIRRHFPYLAPETVAVAHARRAGWLSAQQLGMVMLEAARERGVKLVRGKVVGIDTAAGACARSHVEQRGERQTLEATHLVLAAGPMQKDMARLLGVDLPLFAERHLKVSFADTLGAVPRAAPMLIWLDEQHLPWSDEERAALAEDEEARWLLEEVSRRACTGARRAAAPARRSSCSSTITATRPTSVFPLPDRRRTTPRSRCAACRPWCRRSRPTSASRRGPTSTAATTSRRARTGR